MNALKYSNVQENRGTETLFPHPFLGRVVSRFDAPTESPHLLSKEMENILRVSQNEDIAARGKVSIYNDHKWEIYCLITVILCMRWMLHI